MPNSGSTALNVPMPHQAVNILLLIENSQAMSLIWHDLRDQYLTRLIDKLDTENISIPMSVLVLESLPAQEQGPHWTSTRQSGLYSGLRDIRFNHAPQNKLCFNNINRAIDILSASSKFQSQPVALHLVIVAASAPAGLDDDYHTGVTQSRSPWDTLVQRFAQSNITCHTVLSQNQDTSLYAMLFEDLLHAQNLIEEFPPFPVDRNVIQIRLAARPLPQDFSDAAPFPHLPPQRIAPTRRNTFPFDSHYASSSDEAPNSPPPVEAENPPSLVTQLQQVHGLTKKKVYGSKPARQPFFREERVVNDRVRKAPAPLTLPPQLQVLVQQTSFPSTGGRVVSLSKADRMMRIGQASPTELHSRRSGWPRRGSRFSSPEADVPANAPAPSHLEISSPVHYISSFSPPLSPTSVEDMYNVPPRVPHAPQSVSTPPLHANGVPEPTWLQSQYPQPVAQVSQRFYPLPEQHMYAEQSQFVSNTVIPIGQPVPQTYQPLQDQSYRTDLPGRGMSPRDLESVPSHSPFENKDFDVASRGHKRSQSNAEDEEPFVFNEEYVAATTVLFNQEVLPSYPDFPTGGESLPMASNKASYYAVKDTESHPPSPSYHLGELYASRTRQDRYYHPTAVEPMMMGDSSLPAYPSTYSPGSSSSLTGWAGQPV